MIFVKIVLNAIIAMNNNMSWESFTYAWIQMY